MERRPLSDACMSEILARVSYQWITYSYRHGLTEDVPPPAMLRAIAHGLQEEGFPSLSMWVTAYVREWSPLTPISFIREAFIFRAVLGYTWRAVLYPQYKRNRCDPRVTNRGVAREPLDRERWL